MRSWRSWIATAALLLGGWWSGFAVLATVHAAHHAVAAVTPESSPLSETGPCGLCALGSEPSSGVGGPLTLWQTPGLVGLPLEVAGAADLAVTFDPRSRWPSRAPPVLPS